MKSFQKILWTLMLVGLLGCLDAGNAGSSSDCVQGSGTPRTVERTPDAFQIVSIDGAFNVTITGDKQTALSLTADDNLLPHIVTEVKDRTLHITTSRSICAKSTMKVSVGTPALEAVYTTGANDIVLKKLDGDRLDLQIDGSGSLSASGQTGLFSAVLKGATELRAKDLKAEEVRVTISGAGDAEVYASRSIHALVSGIGNVIYYGHPADVRREITGLGNVTPNE